MAKIVVKGKSIHLGHNKDFNRQKMIRLEFQMWNAFDSIKTAWITFPIKATRKAIGVSKIRIRDTKPMLCINMLFLVSGRE